MKKIDKNGFTIVEGLLIILLVVVIGFVGWFVWSRQNTKKSTNSIPSSTSIPKVTTSTPVVAQVDATKDWTTVTPKNTDNTFIVKVPKSLLPNGTCTTKEVLLGITFNSASYDYSCSGLKDALGYSSIVFGVSSSSTVPTLGTAQSTEKVTLADGKTVATKSVITAAAKGEGGAYTARYTVYEAKSIRTGDNYYAVYSTGVGFSDENKLLSDFTAAVTKGWTLP